MIWSDKFSVAGITDFATKYLLYAYHPNINWFQHFSINLISIGSFGYLLFQYIDDSKNKTNNRQYTGFWLNLCHVCACCI